MTEYQTQIATHVEDNYGITLTRPERIETPDRNGRVYCEALYLATAPWDFTTGARSTDVSRFKFDNQRYANRAVARRQEQIDWMSSRDEVYVGLGEVDAS